MRTRIAIAALVAAMSAALVLPSASLAYPTWLEFTRRTNLASTLTMVWQFGPGWRSNATNWGPSGVRPICPSASRRGKYASPAPYCSMH